MASLSNRPNPGLPTPCRNPQTLQSARILPSGCPPSAAGYVPMILSREGSHDALECARVGYYIREVSQAMRPRSSPRERVCSVFRRGTTFDA